MQLDSNILNLTVPSYKTNYNDDFTVKHVVENNEYVISNKRYNLWELAFIMDENDQPEKNRNNTNIISMQEYTLNTKNDFYYKINNFIIKDFFENTDIFKDEFTFNDSFFDNLEDMEFKKSYLLKSSPSVVIEKNNTHINFFNIDMDIRLTLVFKNINSLKEDLHKCLINLKKSIIVKL